MRRGEVIFENQVKDFENILKNHNWFSKTNSGREIKWFLKKILKLEIKKIWLKMILKNVVKKIWLVLKRCDWEDMIWKTF